MKFSSYNNNYYKADETLFAPRELSRYGTDTLENIPQGSVLEWDILMTQKEFDFAVQTLEKLELSDFKAIRVQDPGAFFYLLNNTTLDIQLILETGNHNLPAIKSWIKRSCGRVKKVILSIELDKKTLKHYISEIHELDCEVELLAAGPILLFYTPRYLLSPLYPTDEIDEKNYQSREFIQMAADSEETAHKGFRLIENKHGTFMFHAKDFYILEELQELQDMNLDYMRLDFRSYETDREFMESASEYIKNNTAIENYPSKQMKGFYRINKSDVLFKKLKNYRLQNRDENFLGEVLDAVSSEYMAVLIKNKNGISSDKKYKLINPEGREVSVSGQDLKTVTGESTSYVAEGDIAILNYVKTAITKSQLFYQ